MTISDDIKNSAPENPAMSLIHTTSVTSFREICINSCNTIIPQTCAVMKEDLTYLFYGRPAYRSSGISATDRNKDSRPVFMLFDKCAVDKYYSVYPLDSGAYNHGVYSPHLDGIDFPDLDCSSIPDAEQKIVSRYFLDNESYFFGDERSELNPNPSSSAAKTYFDFLSYKGKTSYDDRSRTIEVTTCDNLDLSKSLRMVVAPDFLWSDDDIRPTIDGWKNSGVTVRPYRPQSQTNAARTVERLFDVVGDLQGVVA